MADTAAIERVVDEHEIRKVRQLWALGRDQGD